MDIVSHIDFLSLIAGTILIVCGAHVSLLAWLGKRMYAKIDSIEQMVTQSVTLLTEKVSGIEGRVIRVETRLDLVSDLTPRHPLRRREDRMHEDEAA